jgi:hypothetical protein
MRCEGETWLNHLIRCTSVDPRLVEPDQSVLDFSNVRADRTGEDMAGVRYGSCFNSDRRGNTAI